MWKSFPNSKCILYMALVGIQTCHAIAHHVNFKF